MNKYPYYDDVTCMTYLTTINLDALCASLVQNDQGFIVHSSYRSIKKEMNNPEGLFSPKFGRSLSDIDVFGNRYKCECGKTTSRINNGTTCKYCGTKVKYVDDNFEYMGFLKLDELCIIHPNMFKMIQRFIGAKTLDAILKYNDDKDINGYSKGTNENKSEPFAGIGIIAFRERFIEIMNYYKNKNKGKKEKFYYYIMNNLSCVFTHVIPVFTALLRATKNDANALKYEPSNALYVMMSNLVIVLNRMTARGEKERKLKELPLYDLQMKQDELYEMIVVMLSGKKGKLRGVFGGRYNFTSRIVIVQNYNLRVDQVIVPYQAMMELEKQRILNILEKVHGSVALANRIFEKGLKKKNPEIINIINQLIKDDPTGQGIPCLVNRNPTITYGSIQQMFIIGVCDNYTLQMPLQILPYFNADFDGDVLNLARIISKPFYESVHKVFNPRNAMYISMNDGMVSTFILPYKDIMINANTMQDIYRAGYSQSQINKINMIKKKAGLI